MPEKVISGGLRPFGSKDVFVPAQWEFEYLWRVVKQLLDNPDKDNGTSPKQIRAFHDTVRDMEKTIGHPDDDVHAGTLWGCVRDLERNIWRKDQGEQRSTLWDCIYQNRERMDAFDKRLAEIPDIAKEALREVIREKLDPLLEVAGKNIGTILEDNRKLREELASLRAEVNALKASSTP